MLRRLHGAMIHRIEAHALTDPISGLALFEASFTENERGAALTVSAFKKYAFLLEIYFEYGGVIAHGASGSEDEVEMASQVFRGVPERLLEANGKIMLLRRVRSVGSQPPEVASEAVALLATFADAVLALQRTHR